MNNSPSANIALCGNPNCGKSSIFNQLTGLQQKITNVPGTTIERRIGNFTFKDHSFVVQDTPGTYSIRAKSKDEEAALEIFDEGNPNRPDQIVYVADANNLKRNLLFFSQLSELGIPMILVLNMMDVAERKGVTIQIERLEQELGIPVLMSNARKGTGIDELREALTKQPFKPHYNFLEGRKDEEVVTRYDRIQALLQKVVTQKNREELFTEKLDPVLTHPIFGYAIFIGVLLLVFQSVFKLAEYPMELIENGFSWLGSLLLDTLPDAWYRSLLVNGLVAGLAGVMVFIPQIAILFFFMAILEDTGYMSRVSFIMDKLLRGLGLSGKSVVPLLSGAACAIPAIMATRSIENWKDRMITIMVTPLMSCSARLPVYTLLISVAVPNQYIFGFISLKALMLLGMYLLGTVASLLAALVFKFFIKQRGLSFFVMELPVYHPPRWKNVGMMVLNKSKSFVTEAGKVILIVSVVLWFLASYGPGETSMAPTKNVSLEESYAGHFGKVIEPTIKPIGFNWKIGIALLTSFAAREVFVGTMSTIYSVDDEEDVTRIREKMQRETNSAGEPVYSLAVVLSLMIFYAFAMQCISTLAVVYKETKRLKWPLIQFAYMTGLAYVCSFIVYQLLR
ncbi:MAG: ferrous iron transport protein B [Bacteroidia bacterium]|nr:ferrous iron transport protein B [Bacteroidia bacterium]